MFLRIGRVRSTEQSGIKWGKTLFAPSPTKLSGRFLYERQLSAYLHPIDCEEYDYQKPYHYDADGHQLW